MLIAVVLTGCQSGQTPRKPAATPSPPRIISQPSPLRATCGKQPGGLESPAEPSLAVNPKDPRELIAAWIQDRYPGELGNVVAISHDGGASWTESVLPRLTTCTGGIYAIAGDPWVSIGGDGTIYVSSLTRRPADPARPNTATGGVVVSISRDSGRSWELPVVVETQPAQAVIVDKEAVLADPRRPGTAYAVWVEYPIHGEAEPYIDLIYFSRTADGGRTWSKPAAIYSHGDEAQENQLFALPDGTLLDVFIEGARLPGQEHPPPLPVRIQVIRSRDQGQTWSAPLKAAEFTYTNAIDPGTGSQLRFFGQDITAAAGGDSVYVGWFEAHPDGQSFIVVARSSDGGVTWGTGHVLVSERPEVFMPTLAVAADGAVACLWYDFRNSKDTSTALDTDVWISLSHDHALTWTTSHLAGPFDLRAAPVARYGPFIGDYEGLVGLPKGFAAAFVQAQPQAKHAPTDVFFSRMPSG